MFPKSEPTDAVGVSHVTHIVWRRLCDLGPKKICRELPGIYIYIYIEPMDVAKNAAGKTLNYSYIWDIIAMMPVMRV